MDSLNFLVSEWFSFTFINSLFIYKMVHIRITTEEEVNQIMLACSNNTNTDFDLEITFSNDFDNDIHLRIIADMITINRNIQALKLNICPNIHSRRYRPTSEQEQLIADALLINKTIVKFDMDFFNYPLILDALRNRTVYQNDLYNNIYQVVAQRQMEAALRVVDDADFDVDVDVHPRLENEQPHIPNVMLMLVLTSLPTVDCTEHIEYLTQKYDVQRQKALVRQEYHSLIQQEIQLRGYLMGDIYSSDDEHTVEWIEPCEEAYCQPHKYHLYKFEFHLTEEERDISFQRRERITALYESYVNALCE